jgi:hypothetical protein
LVHKEQDVRRVLSFEGTDSASAAHAEIDGGSSAFLSDVYISITSLVFEPRAKASFPSCDQAYLKISWVWQRAKQSIDICKFRQNRTSQNQKAHPTSVPKIADTSLAGYSLINVRVISIRTVDNSHSERVLGQMRTDKLPVSFRYI